jgi:DNA-binding NarL/FixJ family response regulator
VLDVDMPECDGLEVVRFINDNGLSTGVVLLTMYKEERFFNAAMEAGVKGYVLKDSAIDEIFGAIKAVVKGDNFVSPTLSTLLIKRFNRLKKPQRSQLESLTSAECRVLKLVAEAKSNQQIANELFLSVRTVENHRSNICLKLGLEGKNALLTFALTHKTEI